MTQAVVLTAISLILAALRVGGVKHKSYQAIAHVFVGGLGGAWLVTHDSLYAWLFWGLCVVEVICFVVGRVRERSVPAIEPAPKPETPPMTAEQFINRFRRNYVNYAALVEVAFADGDEMFEEYGKLSDPDMHEVVAYARAWAQRA